LFRALYYRLPVRGSQDILPPLRIIAAGTTSLGNQGGRKASRCLVCGFLLELLA